MSLALVDKIANAVLYEGYILYPYRPSAVKNRQRFNFGALYPRAYSEARAARSDRCEVQTECLLEGDERTALDVKVRFLHLLAREVCVPLADDGRGGAAQFDISGTDYQIVDSLEVGGRVYQTWQEAVEREVGAQDLTLCELTRRPQRVTFAFLLSREVELLRDEGGRVAGALVRRHERVEGAVEVSAERVGEGLFRVRVLVLNLTPFEESEQTDKRQFATRAQQGREEALLQSLASTHTILSARTGRFVSLLDPPEEFRAAADECRNEGTWPVLIGAEGERGVMLSSPIILYDYPQVAEESAGDLFDATEIDEILTLRILTLTEEEKREMRSGDERARLILERTEQLPAEQLMKMHGALRGLRAVREGGR